MKRSSLFRILLSIVLNRPKTLASALTTQPPMHPQHLLPDDREAWKAHWKAQGQPWRTEPEIDDKRQQDLAMRLAGIPEERVIEEGEIREEILFFKDIQLSRADMEWLLVNHKRNDRVIYFRTSKEQRQRFESLTLSGADLRGVDLSGFPMEGVNFTNAHLEEANLRAANLEGALLIKAHLEGANLVGVLLKGAYLVEAHLDGVMIIKAHLEGAVLYSTHLEGANLYMTHLENAYLGDTHLEGADLRAVHLEGAKLGKVHLEGCDLREAFFDTATALNDVYFCNEKHGYALLADVHWGGINLTTSNWSRVKMLGDEYEARQKKHSNGAKKSKGARLYEYAEAVRANRQLATVLQAQGLNEDAARFAYRAQVLQRKVLWKQRKFWKWFGSAILAVLAGYGYRMWRIIAAYLIIVTACAVAYFTLGIYFTPHISLSQAFLESVMAFHGRVFYELFNPGEPQIWVTAFEAIAGLVIEGVFIAMLAQRFFGK